MLKQTNVYIGGVMQPFCLTASNDSRHAEIVRRTESAIEELRMAGERISFYSVAERAQVSRSTLYRCDDLRRLVEEAREGVMSSLPEGENRNGRIAELERELAWVTRERDELMRMCRYAPSTRYSYVQISEAA